MREASTALLVEVDAASNVTDLLLERQAANPAHALYRVKGQNGWVDVSAQRFLQDVRSLAKGLIAGGLEPGGTVAVMSAASYEWTLVDFAVWFAGGVSVHVDEESPASELEWILHEAGVRRVFVGSRAHVRLVDSVLETSALLGDRIVNVVRMHFDGVAPDLASLTAAGSGVSDAELERHRGRAGLDDVASLVYTSGTTRTPLGCTITHGNMVLVAKNLAAFLPELLLREQSRALLVLPAAHVFARTVQLAGLVAGTTIGHAAATSEVLDDLRSFQPTFLVAVPEVFATVHAATAQRATAAGKARLYAAAEKAAVEHSREAEKLSRKETSGAGLVSRARHRIFDRLVYRGIRRAFGGQMAFAVSGAGPVRSAGTHFLRGAGIPVLEGYGLSETTAVCTINTPSRTRAGSAGIPLPGTTIRIAEDGEILVKGIGVFRGYHNNAAANSAAFADGFFRTGDLGTLDRQGFLTIIGRKQGGPVSAGR